MKIIREPSSSNIIGILIVILLMSFFGAQFSFTAQIPHVISNSIFSPKIAQAQTAELVFNNRVFLPVAVTPPGLTGGYPIVFVSRQIPAGGSVYYPQSGSLPGVGPYSRFTVAAPGKLIVREPNGQMRILIDGSRPTPGSLNLIDVNAPDVSYDGRVIIFAGLPNGTYHSVARDNPGAWRIYAINVDGTGLRQVTFSDRDNLNLSQFNNEPHWKKYDDTDPVWLPDGRIVFASTRWPSLGMYVDARTTNLYVVNPDGSNLHRITSERNGGERPIIDPVTGKIVYARWWRNFRSGTNSLSTILHPLGGYKQHLGLVGESLTEELGGVPGADLSRNAWQLATINPDGTGLAQWSGVSGVASFAFHNHAYGGSFAPDGSLYTNFFPMYNLGEAAGFGGIRRYQRGPNFYTKIIGITDENYELVSTNPPSFHVFRGEYAAEPEVLPDGRIIISWSPDTRQDYGLYVVKADGSDRKLIYNNSGTTELRARLIRPRPIPPVIPDRVTTVASLLPPLAQGPYDLDGTFTFDALNVYFNAPVDVDIINAIPVGSAGTIRFFIDHQRSPSAGFAEFMDWPILLQELPVNPNGSVRASAPANVPLFEQIRSSQPNYTIPLTSTDNPYGHNGAAHVAGLNFGPPGVTQTCVGCHAGHTMIPVPPNPADAQWTNLATGAQVTASSLSSSITNSGYGLVDRRVNLGEGVNRYWISRSGQPVNSQWVILTFPVPVTVRTVRLYNLPSFYQSQVNSATIKLFGDAAATQLLASKTSGSLSVNGTDVSFAEVKVWAIRIELSSVSGTVAGLAEVEVIARGEAKP
jgi:hypothetical protein